MTESTALIDIGNNLQFLPLSQSLVSERQPQGQTNTPVRPVCVHVYMHSFPVRHFNVTMQYKLTDLIKNSHTGQFLVSVLFVCVNEQASDRSLKQPYSTLIYTEYI